MGIKNLIKNQKIEIDAHHRGDGTANSWDSPNEVHLEKKCKSNKDSYNIKIPLNSNNPVTINRKDNQTVPSSIKKEVENALKDPQTRQEFVNNVLNAIEAYSSNLPDDVKARQAIGYIRKAFNLGIPRCCFRRNIKNFYACLFYYNNTWVYVIIQKKRIIIAANEKPWKRFTQSENKFNYIFDPNVTEILYKE